MFGTQVETQDMMSMMDNLLDSDNDQAQSSQNTESGVSNVKPEKVDASDADSQTVNSTNDNTNNEQANSTESTIESRQLINTEMLSRHNRFQKLLAKRANRVQKLNNIVNKTIQEFAGDPDKQTPTIQLGRIGAASKEFNSSDSDEPNSTTQNSGVNKSLSENYFETVPEKQAFQNSIKSIAEPDDTQKIADQQEVDHSSDPEDNEPLFVQDNDDALDNHLDKEKIEELAKKKKEERLLRDMEEEELVLKKLEAEIGNFRGVGDKKNKKELLDIAMKTQELSEKYNLQPVIFTKIEISKDDLLADFGFENGEFRRREPVSSSGISSKGSDREEVIDVEKDSETEVSDFEHDINLKSNDNIPSSANDPLHRYTEKLKEDAGLKGEIVLDSDSDSNHDSSNDEEEHISKAKMFEIKLKFAKKNKNKHKIPVKPQSNNMSKKALAQLMMQKHRETVIKNRVEHDMTLTGNLFDDSIEGSADSNDVSVERLMENEMMYRLNREQRLKKLQEEERDNSDGDDPDYEGEDEEEEEEEEEGEMIEGDEEDSKIEEHEKKSEEEIKEHEDEKVEQKDDEKDENEKNNFIQSQTQISYNRNLLSSEDQSDSEKEEEEAVPISKRSASKHSVLLESDDEEEPHVDSKQNSSQDEIDFHLPQSSQIGTCEEADFKLLIGANGLTQKIGKLFGGEARLSQAFEASIPPVNYGQSLSQGTLAMQKIRDMKDVAMLEDVATVDISNDEPSFDNGAFKTGHDHSFVAGFEFEPSNNPIDQQPLVVTQETPELNEYLESQTQEDGILVDGVKPKRLVRRREVIEESEEEVEEENEIEEEEDEEEEEEIDFEEMERLRIEENKKLFALERKKELLKKKKELEMERRGLKDVFDQEAEESDDEWQGFGGRDHDDVDAADSEDEKMIDNITKVTEEQNERLLQYINDEDLANDQEMIEKLQRDIETGRLGRKGPTNYLEIDDEADGIYDEAIMRFRQLRKAQQDKRIMENQGVFELSKQKKTRAFFESIAEETNTYGFRESFGERFMFGHDSDDETNKDTTQKKRKIELDESFIKKTLSFIDSDDDFDELPERKRQKKGPDGGSLDAEDDIYMLKRKSVFSKTLSRQPTKVIGLDEDVPTSNSSRSSSTVESNSLVRKNLLLTLSAVANFKKLKDANKNRVSEGSHTSSSVKVVVAQGYKAVGGNSASITYLQNKSVVERRGRI